ncbi:MAG: hypothetical protein ACYDC1_05150 [Limisphaerales bacterium]
MTRASAITSAAMALRTQSSDQQLASSPAARTRKSTERLIRAAMATSLQLTPPNRRGTISQGNMVKYSVRARRTWAVILPTMTPPGRRGVSSSKPSVPSRRSRLMASATSNGTTSHSATNIARLRLPKSAVPNTCAVPGKGRPSQLV